MKQTSQIPIYSLDYKIAIVLGNIHWVAYTSKSFSLLHYFTPLRSACPCRLFIGRSKLTENESQSAWPRGNIELYMNLSWTKRVKFGRWIKRPAIFSLQWKIAIIWFFQLTHHLNVVCRGALSWWVILVPTCSIQLQRRLVHNMARMRGKKNMTSGLICNRLQKSLENLGFLLL